jgi:hypothetical protein
MGDFMSKAVRCTLSLAVSLVLFSAVALAQAGGNSGAQEKGKNKEHHSRLAKIAFWRHHDHSDKNTKQAQVKKVQSKLVQAKAAQMKPSVGKAPAKKVPAAKKARAKEKAHGRTTAL